MRIIKKESAWVIIGRMKGRAKLLKDKRMLILAESLAAKLEKLQIPLQ